MLPLLYSSDNPGYGIRTNGGNKISFSFYLISYFVVLLFITGLANATRSRAFAMLRYRFPVPHVIKLPIPY